MSEAPGQPRKFEIFLAIFSACLLAFFAILDTHLLHPGAAFPDEMLQLQWLQEFKEGLALPLSFGAGCLQRFAMLPAALGGLGLKGLSLSGQVFFAGECLLLYALGKHWLSQRAGLWAVVVCALSSFTLLRLRSLLSYSILPFELLLWLYLLTRARRAVSLFLLGALAGLLLLDYEAWILGLAVLGLAAWQEAEPQKLKPLALGALAGACLVLGLSYKELPSYMPVLHSQNLPASFSATAASLFSGLKGYWLGGPALANTGIRDQPAFPLWAFLPLLAGFWVLPRKQLWFLAWAALGLLPLLARNSAAEPQRAILAWPVLCLIAGAGAAWLAETRAWAPAALLTLALAGALIEGRAYFASMRGSYRTVYGPSLAVLEAAQASVGALPLTEFDNDSSAAARFLLPQASSEARLALIPREYCLKQNHLSGEWLTVPEHAGPCLFRAELGTWERLKKIDSELGTLWRSLPRFDLSARRKLVLDYYQSHPKADVWVRTACLEQIFGTSFLLGEMPLDLLKQVENDKFASVSLLLWSSTKLQHYDPAWSESLLTRAAAMDPMRVRP